jgi:hypothetical protein
VACNCQGQIDGLAYVRLTCLWIWSRDSFLNCFRRNAGLTNLSHEICPITAADRTATEGGRSSSITYSVDSSFTSCSSSFMPNSQTSNSKTQQPNPTHSTTVPSTAPIHSRKSLFGPLLAVSIAVIAILFGPSVLRRLPAFTPLLRPSPPASRTVFTPPQWTMPGKNDDNDPRWNGCVGVWSGSASHLDPADEAGVV